jgi:hypothetical protein
MELRDDPLPSDLLLTLSDDIPMLRYPNYFRLRTLAYVCVVSTLPQWFTCFEGVAHELLSADFAHSEPLATAENHGPLVTSAVNSHEDGRVQLPA